MGAWGDLGGSSSNQSWRRADIWLQVRTIRLKDQPSYQFLSHTHNWKRGFSKWFCSEFGLNLDTPWLRPLCEKFCPKWAPSYFAQPPPKNQTKDCITKMTMTIRDDSGWLLTCVLKLAHMKVQWYFLNCSFTNFVNFEITGSIYIFRNVLQISIICTYCTYIWSGQLLTRRWGRGGEVCRHKDQPWSWKLSRNKPKISLAQLSSLTVEPPHIDPSLCQQLCSSPK